MSVLEIKQFKFYNWNRYQLSIIVIRVNLQDDFFDLEADLSSDQIDFEGHFQGEGRLNALIFNTKGFYNNTMSQ